jgi:hypothetical protein
MRKTLIALSTTVLFLSGCSVSVGNTKSESSSSSTPQQADAGIKISGQGFSFNAPKGWENITEQLGDQFAAGARETGETDGFADNVNVIRTGKSGATFEEVKRSIKSQLEQAGGKNIALLDDTKLDGVTAAHGRAEIPVPENADGLIAHVDQYYVITDEGEYVLTITSQTGFDEAKPKANAAAILNSWKWQ